MNLPKAEWTGHLQTLVADGWKVEKPPVGQYARLSKGSETAMLEPDGTMRPIVPEPVPPQQVLSDAPLPVPARSSSPARVQDMGSFEVSAIPGIPAECVITLNGRPYVTQAGLLLKAERKGGYRSMHAEITGEVMEDGKLIGYKARGYIYPHLSKADLEMVRALCTVPPELQARLMDEIGRPYTATATATTKNVKMAPMHAYLKEMACTRALNRVLRVYTALGFTSAEEMDSYEEIDADYEEVD